MSRKLRSRVAIAVSAVFILTLGQGCAPSSLGYLNIENAHIVNNMRVDGRVTDSTFSDAVGVGILDATTVGIAIGVTGGHGVVVQRNGDAWSAPLPVDLISGSIGLQLGGKNAKILMVFRSQESFDGFVYKGSDFVAEASGAAGSAAGSAGDPLSHPDVEIIADVGGFYGGAVIGGIGVSVNNDLLHKAYGEGTTPEQVLQGKVKTPAGADALWTALKR
ncbi:MAG: hypothetical protein MK085_05245 [Phycisphaerales bacterium]|nr:hypothetical protein [Phycisphaerales bacterium]